MLEKRLTEIKTEKEEIRSKLTIDETVNLEEIESKIEALEAEERAITKKIEIAGKLNASEIRGVRIQKTDIAQQEKDDTSSMEYRKAFMKYALKGEAIPEELRADATTFTTDVGAVIPETILNKIVEKLEATGMILALVTRTNYKGGLSIPISSVKPVASWVAEGAGSDKQKKPVGSIVFAYHKLRCAVAVSLEVDTMALSAFETTLINNVTEAMTKALEQAIISGDGVGKPKGILTEAPETGQSITATPKYTDAVKAWGAVPQEYEANVRWCMTKKTFSAFEGEMDANGQPVARVNYGINGRIERSLLGVPVVLCNYLNTYDTGLASGDAWAFLFDFSDYTLNTNLNMTIKRYEDNENEDQVTKAVMLVDGKVVDKNSLVVLTA